MQPVAAAHWARRRPTGCTPTPAPLGAAQVWVGGRPGGVEARREGEEARDQTKNPEYKLNPESRVQIYQPWLDGLYFRVNTLLDLFV